jgi:pimeloyl-ACP methyl ester carboxylesterase
MKARAGDVELEYDTFGDRTTGRPLLLIMGLGSQMVAWPVGLCENLVRRGFFVIRFDNRDIGLSSHLDHLGVPDRLAAALGQFEGGYTLDDMAADAVGVLDHLGIDKAHVAGASMGGMIAQLVALNHPERVLTLTSIMSHLGGEDAVAPQAERLGALLALPPEDREGRVAHGLEVRRALAGGNPIDEATEREQAALAVDRSWHPAGTARQLAAIGRAPSRRERLQALAIPTLVVHGVDDPLVPVENGRRTAAAVPGARYLEITEMGHHLPPAVWPRVAGAIAELAADARTDARTEAAAGAP